jgi:hypothetical protein
MSEPASPVTELRLRLRRAGYAPLPVAGKEPIVKEWETKTEVTEHEITNWEFTHPACTNTGALTRLMPALDIDIMNEAAAIAVEALAAIGSKSAGISSPAPAGRPSARSRCGPISHSQ